ncbi:hypothetical protein HHI36_018485 [Cryptolaemus montrouzieri]|uniref:Uncharacterized protein n=1 Tax=Cryptolaemus montrouzieri TaxID=559131 RepID=A0ABD2P112_9CUCU
MDPSFFYGRSKHINSIPGDGSLSDANGLASDSDPEYETYPTPAFARKQIIIPESESDMPDDDNAVLLTSATSKAKNKKAKQTKAKVKWEAGKLDVYDRDNLKFRGIADLPEIIQRLNTPAYFIFLFTNKLIDLFCLLIS